MSQRVNCAAIEQHHNNDVDDENYIDFMNTMDKDDDKDMKSPKKTSYTHDHSFPTTQEEYTHQFVFDPTTMFGSPYGGYARATRSRLAALPLRLVGGSTFQTTAAGSDTNLILDKKKELSDDGSQIIDNDADNDDDGNSLEHREEFHSKESQFSSPYFTVRDGEGRQFACRIYHEDELDIKSRWDSMFDEAVQIQKQEDHEDEKVNDQVSSESLEKKEESDEEFTNRSEKSKRKEDEGKISSQVEEGADKEIYEDGKEANVKNVNKQDASTTDNGTRKEGGNPDNKKKDSSKALVSKEDELKMIEKSIAKLNGKCSQIHTGWWSYEWCHEKGVSQFHVEVQKKRLDEAVAEMVKADGGGNVDGKAIPNIVVESMTTVGLWDGKRHVVVSDHKPRHDGSEVQGKDVKDKVDKDIYKDGSSNGIKEVVITEHFDRGDFCAEAGRPRHIEVTLRCCEELELKKGANGKHDSSVFFSNNADEAHALLLKINERQTCQYTATVCTNVLCDEALSQTLDDIRKNNDRVPSKNDNNGIDDFASQLQNSRHQLKRFKRDDSVRDILSAVLKHKCLEIKDGWWSYGFCHKKNAYQFHEIQTVDATRGTLKTVVEDKYILGKYDKATSGRFPKEEEIQHMRKLDEDGNSERKSGKKSNSKKGSKNKSAGGNGAYYIQEYIHGDVCDESDVTDSTIKGGAVVDGGIERATTVRFSCGNELGIKQIDEDSTCHYILDVTVPELCNHQFFEMPRLKTQVVKCLPVTHDL